MGITLTDACFETTNSGFHIHFENNWLISVQIGCGTYSDNQDKTNTVNKETGEWEPQAYAYVLDGAYGGFELQQMCRTGSGCTEPLNTGHIPARELSGLLGVMIKTIEVMQTRHHSVRNWAILPNSE